MIKPEKYLVLSRSNVIALYNQIIEEQINCGYGGVILRCEMSGKAFPGQLQLTSETKSELYAYWPIDGDEVFKVEGAV
jgi:hypothetical protein